MNLNQEQKERLLNFLVKNIEMLKEPMADMESFNVTKTQLMRMIDGNDINIKNEYEKKLF